MKSEEKHCVMSAFSRMFIEEPEIVIEEECKVNSESKSFSLSEFCKLSHESKSLASNLEMDHRLQLLQPERPFEQSCQQVGEVDQSNFCRKSFKYLVRPENKQKVLEYIEQYLPVHYFDKSAASGRSQKVTSVYFDDREHLAYQRRINEEDGSTLIRIRWYGDNEAEKVFVERKTHKCSAASIKERFKIKAKYADSFVVNQMSCDNLSRPALAQEIQIEINSDRCKLEPTIRTTYHRIAFQLENSNKVRITADENLIFSKESSEQCYGKRSTLHNAKPFPLMVLEVKLQDEFIDSPPAWLTNLMGSDLIQDANKFSKFASATEQLLL